MLNKFNYYVFVKQFLLYKMDNIIEQWLEAEELIKRGLV